MLAIGAGFPAYKPLQSQPAFQSPFYKEAAKAINRSLCTTVEGSLKKPKAAVIVTNVIYKLIKENPQADILTELQKAQDEYNKNN